MIKFRLYSDRRLIDLLSLYVPEKSEIEELDDDKIIIKIIFNGIDYHIRSIDASDKSSIRIGRYRSVYPNDPEFNEKLIFISDLVDKYNRMSYTEVINDLTNKVK